MTKLYLVNPVREGTLEGNPYSLLYLAEWCRRNSEVDVEVVSDISNMDLEGDVYVGISVTTPTYQKGLDLARRVKEENPNAKTILGGYHTKSQGNIIFNYHPEIDFVVEGEGEKALVDILKGSTDNVVLGTPLTSEELDSITIEDLLRLNPEYFQTMRQFGRMNYVSSRGCSNRCSFCASSGRLTTKSIDAIVDDLETLEREGFREVSIQDNYFGYNPRRIQEICEAIIERGLEFDLDCQTRVESLQDEETLKLMKKAGFSAVYIGTENFHPEALHLMEKTADSSDYLDMTKNVVTNMLDIGIIPYINLQLGLPYETSEIREANVDGLEELGKIASENGSEIVLFTHLNVVYPGTSDFSNLLTQGVPEDVFESFSFWSVNKGIDLGKNSFIHGSGGIPLGIMNFDKLKRQEFKVDCEKVEEINQYLERIGEIKGVRVFDGF